jgi:hypothetical protein
MPTGFHVINWAVAGSWGFVPCGPPSVIGNRRSALTRLSRRARLA